MLRIEISSGGLGTSVMDFQSDLTSFLFDAESMISSFKAVQNSTYSLNGGVGDLQSSLSQIESRIQTEEAKKLEAEHIQAKANDFIQLAERVDHQVESCVNQNKEELYYVNPCLKPSPSVTEEATWYERARLWLCGKGEVFVEGVKTTWEWTKDTAFKAWNGIVAYYSEHKKIIDTILIVAGAVAAIAAVVFTGGLALVPLLGALGVSTATAIAISTAVAVVAVVSTVGSSVLNIVDIWAEIDNPVFNTFQKVLNVVSTVSNITYSIGNIYNSLKGVSGKEYIARQNAIKNGKMGYSNLEADHPNMTHQSGADFDQSRKQAIYKENIRRNNGQLRSDTTGKVLDAPTKSTKGIAPSQYEAQIDHIYPRDLGGANSFGNAQVIERSANIAKSSNPFFTEYSLYSKPDISSISKAGGWGTQGTFSASIPGLVKD